MSVWVIIYFLARLKTEKLHSTTAAIFCSGLRLPARLCQQYLGSTLAVASSMMRMRFFLRTALARHTSCLWPTLKLEPDSARTVSNLPGSSSTADFSWTCRKHGHTEIITVLKPPSNSLCCCIYIMTQSFKTNHFKWLFYAIFGHFFTFYRFNFHKIQHHRTSNTVENEWAGLLHGHTLIYQCFNLLD